jgi:hypothetical protein
VQPLLEHVAAPFVVFVRAVKLVDVFGIVCVRRRAIGAAVSEVTQNPLATAASSSIGFSLWDEFVNRTFRRYLPLILVWYIEYELLFADAFHQRQILAHVSRANSDVPDRDHIVANDPPKHQAALNRVVIVPSNAFDIYVRIAV